MAHDRKQPEVQLKLEPSPDELLKGFNHAFSIPLIHLAKQFVNPGIPDGKDSKGKIDYENLTPDFTREEAFNRLLIRLLKIDEKEKESFISWMKELEDKPEAKLTEFEMIILAIAYRFELGVTQDLNKSFKLLDTKKFMQNGYAQSLLGNIYDNGLGVSKNLGKAFLLYTRASALEVCIGYNGIAQMLESGVCVIKDEKLAFENYLLGAEGNAPGALGNAGLCYISGIGCERDIQKGIDYLAKSILFGTVGALRWYAKYRLEKIDLTKSYQFYKTAVENSSMADFSYVLACFLQGEGKNLENSIQQAAYYFRVTLLRNPRGPLGISKAFEDLFNKHKDDYEINYHHAMATNDEKTLKAALVNDPIHFNQLWCSDIDSRLFEIKTQALKRAISLIPSIDPKLKTFPQRLRANLAIHYFKQENEEGIRQGLNYINGVGVKEITADENYQLGFWLHSIALRQTLVEEESIDIATATLNKHKVFSEDEKTKVIENNLFNPSNKKNPLLQQALAFLKEASDKGHKEAKAFLLQIKSDKLIPSHSIFAADSKDTKHSITAATTAVASSALSLDPDEEDQKKNVKK